MSNKQTMTDQDLHYLKSVLGNLREFSTLIHKDMKPHDYGLGHEILADNIDWLDCFIDKRERALTTGHE